MLNSVYNYNRLKLIRFLLVSSTYGNSEIFVFGTLDDLNISSTSCILRFHFANLGKKYKKDRILQE